MVKTYISTKLLQIYENYANKWVALNSSKDQVLVSGSSIKEVERKLNKQKLTAIEIKYILPMNTYIAPICQ